jgi:hypothetical protein
MPEENMISDKVKAYCKDIEKWPDSWKYDQPDVAVGKMILNSAFIPFIDFLISKKLTKKTIKKHIDNIWLLGGEIAERVNNDESLRDKDGLTLVNLFVDDSGGPYSKHLDSEIEMNSFDSTCRKLFKYFNQVYGGLK